MARLAAPRRKAELSAEVTVPQNRRKVVLLAAGGGLVLAAAAFTVLVLPHLRSGPTVAQALGPLAADITRDHFPAYKQAVETLKGAAGEGKAPALRGAAAELQLLALLARGADKAAERAAVSELEPVLEAAPTGADAPPEVVRARALLALARGRGADAETALGAQASTPVGQMIIGLRRWRERKPDLAIKQLKARGRRRAVAGAGAVPARPGAGGRRQAGRGAGGVRAGRWRPTRSTPARWWVRPACSRPSRASSARRPRRWW